MLKSAAAISLVIVGFSAQAETPNEMSDYLTQQVTEQTQLVVMELGSELQQSAAALVAESMGEFATAATRDAESTELAEVSELETEDATTSVIIAGR